MFPKTCTHPSCAPPHASLHVPEMLDGICSSECHKHCLLVKKNKYWKGGMNNLNPAFSLQGATPRKPAREPTHASHSVSSSVKMGRKNTESAASRVIKWLLWRATHGTFCSCAPNHPPTWVFLSYALTTESSAWTLLLKCDGAPGCLLLPFSSSLRQDVIFISANSRELCKITFSWKDTIEPLQKYNVPIKRKKKLGFKWKHP